MNDSEKVQSNLRNQMMLPKEGDYADKFSGYQKRPHEKTQFGSLPSKQLENMIPFCRQGA